MTWFSREVAQNSALPPQETSVDLAWRTDVERDVHRPGRPNRHANVAQITEEHSASHVEAHRMPDRERRVFSPRSRRKAASSTAVLVSLILPAHDEEMRLANTLHLYGAALKRECGSAFELLVICNGCTDGTAAIATEVARKIPQVQVVIIPDAIGKGGAILAGLQLASGERLGFADADAATDPASLIELLRLLDSYEVVIGSRRLPASIIGRRQSLGRRVCGRVFVRVARLLFGLPYPDTQCGAKAFRAAAAQRLARVVTETRWTFDLDLLLAARVLGLQVGEHPVHWTDQPGSRLRLLPTAFTVATSLWRLLRKYAPYRVPLIKSFMSSADLGDSLL